MFNREEGNTRIPNGITQEHDPIVHDLLKRQMTPVPNMANELISKLLTAYNGKAMANPAAPLISQYEYPSTTADGNLHMNRTLVADDRNGDRLGFLSRDASENGVRYGVGIDNMGDPYRGVYDAEQSTPFGTLDYGYDGDTVAAGFTPNGKTQAYIQALANLLNRR